MVTARSLLLTFACLLPAASAQVLAPDASATAPPSARASDALHFSFAGIEHMLVDPRDQGLRRFLADFTRDLPAILREFEVEDPAIGRTVSLLLEMVQAPWELSIAPHPGNSEIPVASALRFKTTSLADARELEARLLEVLLAVGVEFGALDPSRGGLRPLVAFPDLEESLPALACGATSDGTTHAFTVTLNGASGGSERPTRSLPAGYERVAAMTVDIGRIMDCFPFDCADPEIPPGVRRLCQLARDVKLDMVMGHGADRTCTEMVVTNATPLLADLGLLADGAIPLEHLRILPPETRSAVVGRFDPRGVRDTITRFSEDLDPFAAISAETGIDVEALLATLGKTAGYYVLPPDPADELDLFALAMPYVAFFHVADPEGLRPIVEQIEAAVAAGAEEAEAEAEHAEYGQFDVEGLRPALRLEANFLFVAFGRERVERAARHARDLSRSLIDRPEVAAMAADGLENLWMFVFEDTPARAAEGYDNMLMLVDMVAEQSNGMEVELDLEEVFPPRSTLLDGAKPRVTTIRRVGEDFVCRSFADRSFVLQLAGMGGGAAMGLFLGLGAQMVPMPR